MKDIAGVVSAIIGGAFLGWLASIFAFFVVQLVREGIESPKEKGLPAFILLLLFGTPLAYICGVVLDNWMVGISAIAMFAWLTMQQG